MLTIDQLSTARLDELNDELAAAGHPSDHQEVYSARWAVANVLAELGGLDLYDSETGAGIRPATALEIMYSALASAEGHIEVDGRTCYVA